MKEWIKIALIIIGSVVAILLCFFIVDFVQAKRMKHPVFCRRLKEYWDGGSYECYGIFYKINTYTDDRGKILKMEIGPYSMKFDKNSVMEEKNS